MTSAERVIDRFAGLVPWPKRNRTCFFNLRPTLGGPGTFAQKLVREFENQNIHTTFRRLRSAQAALLFSVSWGDWFQLLCRRWDVRTVLRVDGFLLPTYFDNRPQPNGYQDRSLKLSDMALNYRLQRDLLLSDYVIYQSAFSKQMADQFLYNRRSDFAIVHNGVDLQRFQPGPARSGRRRLLSAGSLRDEYMLGTVLPVFGRLWQQHDLELLVVGSLAPICQHQIETFRAANPQAADRIQVTGPVRNDDLPGYFQQTDVLVHPRLGDWCPNVVVEALACGVPLVCGSWGGAAELIDGGGLVVETGQWTYGEVYQDRLCDAVETVLGDLDAYKRQARERAEAALDIRLAAGAYVRAMMLAQNVRQSVEHVNDGKLLPPT